MQRDAQTFIRQEKREHTDKIWVCSSLKGKILHYLRDGNDRLENTIETTITKELSVSKQI